MKFLVFKATSDGITLNEYETERELIDAIDSIEENLQSGGKLNFSSNLESFEPKAGNDCYILILKGEVLVPERVIKTMTVGFRSP